MYFWIVQLKRQRSLGVTKVNDNSKLVCNDDFCMYLTITPVGRPQMYYVIN